MKTLYRSLLLSSGALALAGAAFGQVPSTNDTSDGNGNTGMGSTALAHLTTGASNTASGLRALEFNTDGSDNTASGFQALFSNTTGNSNTASGSEALFSSTTGNGNSASGFQALGNNTSGSFNTATGYQALSASDADYNTAFGYLALFSNTTGTQNVASGAGALYANTTGNYNAALGQNALVKNTTASNNTATGFSALSSNTIGNDNTAAGTNALQNNTTGSRNIAVGFQAGSSLTTGNNNIDLASKGAAADSDTIRIGIAATHKATFIAGIFGTSVTGSAVVVSSTGKLGVTVSSERYKTAIAPMGENTAKLGELRPVTFHLKNDPKGDLQYGLIAEEVAKVYPELVIRDEKGRIDGVRYDELAPMLLNEVQQLKQQMAEMHAALGKLQSKDASDAQR